MREFASEIVARLLDRVPCLPASSALKGTDRACLEDVEYHLTYLREALALADPALLQDYLGWARSSRGNPCLATDVLEATLAETRAVLRARLPEGMADLADGYLAQASAALTEAALTEAPGAGGSGRDPALPLAGLAGRYIDALLSGKSERASQAVLDALQRGVPVRDIYLGVFQPAQVEIGRLWQLGQASIAQEHYFSAATQLIMSRIAPHVFSAERVDRRLVAACVSGETHQIGLRIVADFFEMAGWDTYFLGADTPALAILEAVETMQPDILGISATMPYHVRTVAEVIRDVRASEAGAQVRILVGGGVFSRSPDLCRTVGADAIVRDADAAVQVATRLLRGDGNYGR